jgi:hypothetical protein
MEPYRNVVIAASFTLWDVPSAGASTVGEVRRVKRVDWASKRAALVTNVVDYISGRESFGREEKLYNCGG